MIDMIRKYAQFRALLSDMDVKTDVPLKELTSFRIGGPAAFVVRPKTESELCRALSAAEEAELPLRILGNGTNVLAPDAGFPGLVLRLDAPFFRCASTAVPFTRPLGNSSPVRRTQALPRDFPAWKGWRESPAQSAAPAP